METVPLSPPDYDEALNRLEILEADIQNHVAIIENRGAISEARKLRINGTIYRMGQLISEQFADGLSRDELAAIRLTSLGYPDAESAQIENTNVTAIEWRRRRVMEQNGAKTKAQNVFTSIQKGYVPVNLEKDGPMVLPPDEYRLLCHLANGYTTQEVADKYQIGRDAMNQRIAKLRHGLKAKNVSHIIRRAFEVGVFKVGEPMPDFDDEDRALRLKIDDNELDLKDLGITKPSEFELLKHLSVPESGLITFNAMSNEFYPTLSPRGRRSIFGHTLVEIAKKLEAIFVEPIIEYKKIKINGQKNTVYVFRKAVVIEAGDKKLEFSAYEGPISLKKSGVVQQFKQPKPPAPAPVVQETTKPEAPEPPVPETPKLPAPALVSRPLSMPKRINKSTR